MTRWVEPERGIDTRESIPLSHQFVTPMIWPSLVTLTGVTTRLTLPAGLAVASATGVAGAVLSSSAAGAEALAGAAPGVWISIWLGSELTRSSGRYMSSIVAPGSTNLPGETARTM